jgi:hypothetical protein
MNTKNNTILNSLQSVLTFDKLRLQKSWGHIKKSRENIRFNLLKFTFGDSRIFPHSVLKNESYEGLRPCP